MRLYVPIFVLALLALGFAAFSVTFVITVLVAYAYIWRRGGLDWD